MSTSDRIFRYGTYLVIAGAVLAAALGLTGSDGRAQARGGEAALTWPSVTRQGLAPSLRLEVTNRSSMPTAPALRLRTAYLDGLQPTGVWPEPRRVVATGADTRMEWDDLAPGESLAARVRFDLHDQATHLRLSTPARVTLGRREVLRTEVTTTVLP